MTGSPRLITTLGPKGADELGVILPHEHLVVDLRTPDARPLGEPPPAAADVVALMGPEVERAAAVGVTAIVEATPVGVGRRVDAMKAVSAATGVAVSVATGIYREPWVPAWAHAATLIQLTDWMLGELTDQIEATGVRAGWIKVSATDDGMTATERTILRAAARAGRLTGAAIGSHTVRGDVVRRQLDLLEAEGFPLTRFVWIHAQLEPDPAVRAELARRGVWVEFDDIGAVEHEDGNVAEILRMLELGFGDQLLLSQDRGWYDPAKPGGGDPLPFTYLVETFLPRLRREGVDDRTIERIVRDNPFRAFAR